MDFSKRSGKAVHRRWAAWLTASLIVAGCVAGRLQAATQVEVLENIQWTVTEDMPLTLDIYRPQLTEQPLPVIVMFHGGGWLINTNDIVSQTATYLAEHGQFMVVNVNYRLLGDAGNTVTMNEIIEDALGAVVWVQHNIAGYQGDPERVVVTGDSAGGHLAAMVLAAGQQLGEGGFNAQAQTFLPSYLPEGTDVSALLEQGGIEVQGAVISYGAFDIKTAAAGGFESDGNIFWQLAGAKARSIFGAPVTITSNPDWYEAVSPLYQIPDADQRRYPPQFVHVGELDRVTPPQAAQAYVDALKHAGHPVEYRVYPDRNHAYLNDDCVPELDVCFAEDAPEVLDDAIDFVNRIFPASN